MTKFGCLCQNLAVQDSTDIIHQGLASKRTSAVSVMSFLSFYLTPL